MRELWIRTPDDFHVHLRQGTMMQSVVQHTASQFGRALIMPNTQPPILTSVDAISYEREIKKSLTGADFTPLMSIKLLDTTTPWNASEAFHIGVVAAKLYPRGVTTNSEDGVSDPKLLYPVFETMQEDGMLLLLHGENPNAFCLDRERAFLQTLTDIALDFPKLKIVLEHVSTKAAIECVQTLPKNVAATITAHHMVLTLDDVIGGELKPHYFCKPIAKHPTDQRAVLTAAISGNPKFFFGSDSAPHPIGRKEADCCAAGVFTAPILLPLLAKLFGDNNSLLRLEEFVSVFGADFYGLFRNVGRVSLIREEWQIPVQIERGGGVKIFNYFKTLPWKFEGRFI